MWYYNNKEFTAEDADVKINEGYIGFVYNITDLSNSRKYIGKKLILTRRKRPPLKGQKRKRIDVVQSDWSKYYGSSDLISESARSNPEGFRREILFFCKSKGELNYREAELQFHLGVLLSDDYYNAFIGCKINASHLKKIEKIDLQTLLKRI